MKNLYTNTETGERILIDRVTVHDTYFYRQNDTHALCTMPTSEFRAKYRKVKEPLIKEKNGRIHSMRAGPVPTWPKQIGGKSDGTTNPSSKIYGPITGGAYKTPKDD